MQASLLLCSLNEAHRATRHAQVEAAVAALTKRIVAASGGAGALAAVSGGGGSGHALLQAMKEAVPGSRDEVCCQLLAVSVSMILSCLVQMLAICGA